ncbi:MAG TPA: DUF4197 domain-containing protein [Candidatus Limnocylindrales bacterium]|nr:DUF4197 domain-containing protein [Candidatus Limnocylindrales bacterium]
MRKGVMCLAVLAALAAALPSRAGLFDEFIQGIGGGARKGEPDTAQIVSGLKEALSIGTGKAVATVSKTDGYFGNPSIKILLPENLRKAGDVLGKIGYQHEVDDFVVRMNRAAEKAAPRAKPIFVDALKAMTFEDARKILGGGDTAATEYFQAKTRDRLYEEFKPVVSSSMDEVGTVRSYKAMTSRYSSLPFVRAESLDLDHYVTDKALEGIFYMVAQEEKKIRTDPAARVTDLLKAVFGRK